MKTGDFIRLRQDIPGSCAVELLRKGEREERPGEPFVLSDDRLLMVYEIPSGDYIELLGATGKRYLLREADLGYFETVFIGKRSACLGEDDYYRCLRDVVCEVMDSGFQITDRVWLGEGTLIYVMSCEDMDVIASAMGVTGVVRLNPSDAIFFERVTIVPPGAPPHPEWGKRKQPAWNDDEIPPQPAPGGDDTMTWHADAGAMSQAGYGGERHD